MVSNLLLKEILLYTDDIIKFFFHRCMNYELKNKLW